MSSVSPHPAQLQAEVERHPWHHTLELGTAAATKVGFDQPRGSRGARLAFPPSTSNAGELTSW